MKGDIILGLVLMGAVTLAHEAAYASGTEKESPKPTYTGSGSERTMPDTHEKDNHVAIGGSDMAEKDSTDSKQDVETDSSADGSGTEREMPKHRRGSGTERN